MINKVVVLENSMNSFVKQQNEHMVTLRRIICASNSNNAGPPPNIQIPRSVLPSVTEVFDSPNTNKRKRIEGEVTDWSEEVNSREFSTANLCNCGFRSN